MKHLKLKLILLVLLICLAFASAAFAVKPLIDGAEKSVEVKQAVETFNASIGVIRRESEEKKEVIPYANLYEAMQTYNRQLYLFKQNKLDSKSAYEQSQFTLTDYGLPDEKFGVITIPKMGLEMPLFLGASEENMAAGAAVLSQTSIPLGGNNTNAVIAGHRGYSGYPYFKEIELLEVGDEVTITNIWGTLTYTVTEIKIINPNDVNAILIQKDKDMITLLTCHPYASGGKYRYLVFCERVKA
ncbi:MAG: class C sortase [Oscillospiraceae bacterium]|nr:class C sortase [Oscillospiraceae bacterium]